MQPFPFPDLRTERLRIADWRPELDLGDRQNLLVGDLKEILTPAVLAPLPPSFAPSSDDQDLRRWLGDRASEAGVATIRMIEEERVVGLVIVAEVETALWHLGYLLAEETWGQGFATEVLGALTAVAASTGAVSLLAGVARDNPASVRVLEKAGFAQVAGGTEGGDLLFRRDFD